MTLKTVLSISGGGIRGLIPAVILSEIEQRLNDSIMNYVDLVSGTSTGGIIACLLNIGESGKQKYSCSDIVDLYKNFGKIVFRRSGFMKIITLNGMLFNKYSAETLTNLLKNYFGNIKLANTLKEVLIPSYQISNTPYPFFFKTRHALKYINDNIENPYLWEVARCTSAANSYFSPYRMDENHVFLDGGQFANNPSMCAYAEAKKMWKDNTTVISLGTGENLKGYSYERIKNWGMIMWALPFFQQTFISADDTVDYMLRTFESSSNDVYYKLQPELKSEYMQMDNIEDNNIDGLVNTAYEYIKQNNEYINRICRQLQNNRRGIPNGNN